MEDFNEGRFVQDEFDVFLNGSACRIDANPRNILDEMYPTSVMDACRYKTAILHDFIPLFFQEYLRDEYRKTAFALQCEILRTFDLVFANSCYTAASAMRYVPIPKEKLLVIYGGVDRTRFKSRNSSLPYSASTRKNHIVYVGGFAPQKNWQGLCRAFCRAYTKRLVPNDAVLYIVCNASDGSKEELRSLTEGLGVRYGVNVIATGFISDSDMVELLSDSRASIFPSFLEGLGLPVLESYAVGTPCWASGCHSTKELVLPECSFDPFCEDAMIKAVVDIFKRTDLCERSLEFGRSILNSYTWNNAARKMLGSLERLTEEEISRGQSCV